MFAVADIPPADCYAISIYRKGVGRTLMGGMEWWLIVIGDESIEANNMKSKRLFQTIDVAALAG